MAQQALEFGANDRVVGLKFGEGDRVVTRDRRELQRRMQDAPLVKRAGDRDVLQARMAEAPLANRSPAKPEPAAPGGTPRLAPAFTDRRAWALRIANQGGGQPMPDDELGDPAVLFDRTLPSLAENNPRLFLTMVDGVPDEVIGSDLARQRAQLVAEPHRVKTAGQIVKERKQGTNAGEAEPIVGDVAAFMNRKASGERVAATPTPVAPLVRAQRELRNRLAAAAEAGDEAEVDRLVGELMRVNQTLGGHRGTFDSLDELADQATGDFSGVRRAAVAAGEAVQHYPRAMAKGLLDSAGVEYNKLEEAAIGESLRAGTEAAPVTTALSLSAGAFGDPVLLAGFGLSKAAFATPAGQRLLQGIGNATGVNAGRAAIGLYEASPSAVKAAMLKATGSATQSEMAAKLAAFTSFATKATAETATGGAAAGGLGGGIEGGAEGAVDGATHGGATGALFGLAGGLRGLKPRELVAEFHRIVEREIADRGIRPYDSTARGTAAATTPAPSAPGKADLLTPRGAAEWAAANPGAATTIAESGKPSRTQVEQAAPGSGRWSASERARFAGHVKKAVATTQPATGDAAPTGSAERATTPAKSTDAAVTNTTSQPPATAPAFNRGDRVVFTDRNGEEFATVKRVGPERLQITLDDGGTRLVKPGEVKLSEVQTAPVPDLPTAPSGPPSPGGFVDSLRDGVTHVLTTGRSDPKIDAEAFGVLVEAGLAQQDTPMSQAWQAIADAPADVVHRLASIAAKSSEAPASLGGMNAAPSPSPVDRIRSASAEVLSTPLMSDGSITPSQIARMSKADRETWQRNTMKRLNIEAQIRDLQRPEGQPPTDGNDPDTRSAREGLARIEGLVADLARTGIGKRGTIRPSVQQIIDHANAERGAILAEFPALAADFPPPEPAGTPARIRRDAEKAAVAGETVSHSLADLIRANVPGETIRRVVDPAKLPKAAAANESPRQLEPAAEQSTGNPRKPIARTAIDLLRDEQGAVALSDIIGMAESGVAGVGFVVREGVVRPIAGTARLTKALADWYAKPLVGIVEGQGGHVGKFIASEAAKANDAARKILGKLQPRLRRYGSTVAGKTPATRRAVKDLQRIDWDAGDDYGFTRFQSAVEGRIGDERLTETERAIVSDFRRLMQTTGRMAKQRGIRAYDSATGEWVAFTPATDGARLARRPTAEMLDIMRNGEGDPAFGKLAQVLGRANGMDEAIALRELKRMAEATVIKRAPFEAYRVFERFPTHMKVEERIVPLLHANPFTAGTSMVHTTAQRLGFIEQFGQDIPQLKPEDPPSLTDAYIAEFVRAGGNRRAIENLFTALNGKPIDQVRVATPGSIAHEAQRWYRFVMSGFRTALLSRSALVNIPEPLGNTLAFGGLRRFVRAYARLMRHPRDAAIETARNGSRTILEMNLMVEPGRRRESVARIFSDLGLRLTGNVPVNELNETHAAITGALMADDLRAGRGTMFDRERLRIMKFTDDQIGRLMQGEGTRDEYQAVATRFPEVSQGTTSTSSERSGKANTRLANDVIAFDSYAMMKLDRIGRVNRNLFDAFASGDPKRAFAAAGLAAEAYVGTAASGAAALFIRALALGGIAGLAIQWNEAEDDPARFAGESLKYAALSGPAEAIFRTVAEPGEKPIAETIADAALPVSIMQDGADFFAGEGPYRDRSWSERADRFIERNVTATPVVKTAIAAIGVGEKDVALDASIRAYWRWRMKNDPPARFEDREGDDPGVQAERDLNEQFRANMRRALDAMRSGEDPAEHFVEAMAVETKDAAAVARSIRSRRLLASLDDEQRDALRKRIGLVAYRRLESYDSLLTGWAQAINPARSRDGVQDPAADAAAKLNAGDVARRLSARLAAAREVGAEDVATLLQARVDESIADAVKVLGRPIPMRRDAQAAYLSDRDHAAATLRGLGVDAATIRQAFGREVLAGLKSAEGRQAARQRFERQLRSSVLGGGDGR